MKHVCAALVGLSLFASPALAKPHLRDVAEVDGAMFQVAIADSIRKTCPTISARKVKAWRYLRSVAKTAIDLGYTRAEIEAYTKSDEDKARLRAKAEEYFATRGVERSDPQSYCVLGREEIQKASRVGSLLRAE